MVRVYSATGQPLHSAADVLMGRSRYKLKLGFIGVVNRCQADIMKNVTIKKALKLESAYFTSHPVYKTFAHKCGTEYLRKTLNKVSCSTAWHMTVLFRRIVT